MIALTKFLSDERLLAQVGKSGQVISFFFEQYSPLFSSYLINYIARKREISIISQPMSHEQNGQQMAGLQSTFLGQQSVYWLHSDSQSAKKSDDWYTFLATYNGPNTLIFATDNQELKTPESWLVVACPAQIDERLFKELAIIYPVKQQPTFASDIFQQVRTVPLDGACMLYHYGALIGKNSSVFMADWLPRIALAEHSLFTLSQALFSRNISLFFAQWSAIGHLYPAQFWLTFWSEQVWRAYCYIRLQKMGKPLEAKKIGYRLPFSFLNKDWRSYSLERLLKAHQLLYDIDYRIKQGTGEDILDLFYHHFLVSGKQG